MNLTILEAPRTCPYCNSTLIRKNNNDGTQSTDIYCPNNNCIGRQKAHLKYIVGKSVFNIDGFGTSMVDTLYDNNIITNWYDIFTLTTNDLINKANLTEYSSEKLIANIKYAKENANGVTVLMSLGIDGIAEITAKKILSVYNDLLGLTVISATTTIYNNLINVIGNVATNNFIDAFINQNITDVITKLYQFGISTTLSDNKTSVTSDKLKNLKILASGTFENYSRDEIKKVIEENGGTYASGVNKTLDILVCGKNIGPSKLQKAEKLNIKMITEAEFIKMIE